MARLFDDAASDDLTVSRVDVSALPVSMACWVRPNAVPAASHVALSLRRNNEPRGCDLTLSSASNRAIARTAGGASISGSILASAWSLNTWGHCGGVFPSATSRTVYFDGTAGGKNTETQDPFGGSAPNRTTVGMRIQGAEGENFSGDIAEAAIWAAALTAEEFAALAAGTSPLLIRPDALVNYYPIIGRHSPEIDLVGGNDLTVNGATASDHPRMFYPARSRFVPARGVTERTVTASLDADLTLPFAPAGTRTFGHGEDRGQAVAAGGRTFAVPAGNRKH